MTGASGNVLVSQTSKTVRIKPSGHEKDAGYVKYALTS